MPKKPNSLDAPGLERISKGKANDGSAFGVKVGVVACLKRPLILAADALPARRYDAPTAMRSVGGTLNTGVMIKTAVANKGGSTKHASSHRW